MFHHIKKERERERGIFISMLMVYLGTLYTYVDYCVHQYALMHPSYSPYIVSHAMHLRQLHAIAGRTQQVAAPSASFRIFVADLLGRSQDAFPHGNREGERNRRTSCNSPSIREIETRGIRRNRKYIERPMYYYVSVRYNARNKCLADVKTILKIIKIKRDS